MSLLGWIVTSFLALIGVAMLVARGPSSTDAGQLEPVARALLDLDLARAYPPSSMATSPPGYPVAVAGPLALVELGCRCNAYAWIGLLMVPLVVVASVWLAHRGGARVGSTASAVVVIGVLFTPGVTQSLTEVFHPQDLLALTLVVGAAAFTTTGDAGGPRGSNCAAAGALLGLAFATRQWALLPTTVILLHVAPHRRTMLGAATAVGLLVLLPFGVADPAGLARALTAGPVVQSFTLVGRLSLAPTTSLLLARVGPLLIGGAAVWIFARRVPRSEALILELVAVAVGRLLFEPVVYRYYLAPAAVLALCWSASRCRRLIVMGLLFSLVVNFRDLAIGDDTLGLLGALGLEVTLAVAFVWSIFCSRRPASSWVVSEGSGSGAHDKCR